jgi:hypothetical protein
MRSIYKKNRLSKEIPSKKDQSSIKKNIEKKTLVNLN